MERKLCFVIVAAMLSAFFAGCNNSTAMSIAMEGGSSLLTVEEVKIIALEDCGADMADAVFTKAELEDNGLLYAVNFSVGGKDYAYEIDAKSGEIVVFDQDESSFNENAFVGAISREEAMKIALNDADVAESDLDCYWVKERVENDISLYVVTFQKGQWLYSYSVDALSGKILTCGKDLP